MSTLPAPRSRSRLSLLLLLALFAAPVVVAWLAFYVFPDWRPEGTMNHGTLIEPMRPLPAFAFQSSSGEPIDETFLRGKWNLVYLMQGACERSCVEQLYKLRQVRLAQGKNIDRIQRLVLWQDGGAVQRGELDSHFPGQVLVTLDGQPAPALLAAFALDERNPLQAGRAYLVDPLGNLMMYYEPDADPAGMIRDLERLLKYSGLG